MRIALALFGQSRCIVNVCTLMRSIKTLFNVVDEDLDLYVHTWNFVHFFPHQIASEDIEMCGFLSEEGIVDFYKTVSRGSYTVCVESKEKNQNLDIPNTYGIPMFYSMARALELIEELSNYDLVVLTRPDLQIWYFGQEKFQVPEGILEGKKLGIFGEWVYDENQILGIADTLFVGTLEQIRKLQGVWTYVQNIYETESEYKNLFNEQKLRQYLLDNSIEYQEVPYCGFKLVRCGQGNRATGKYRYQMSKVDFFDVNNVSLV